MADIGNVEIDMGDALSQHKVTIQVRIVNRRWTRFRFWLGRQIIQLGCRVAGFASVEIVEEESPELQLLKDLSDRAEPTV